MQTSFSHLYTHPCLHFIPLCPPPLRLLARSPCSPRSSSFLYDELLGGFGVWQEALSLIRDEKRKGERKKDGEKKKKTKKEGENLRPPRAFLLTL